MDFEVQEVWYAQSHLYRITLTLTVTQSPTQTHSHTHTHTHKHTLNPPNPLNTSTMMGTPSCPGRFSLDRALNRYTGMAKRKKGL